MGKPNSFPFQISAIFAIFLVLGFASASFSSDPFAEQERDRVGRLPGQNFSIDFAHYAGYVTVNEEAGRALFYWFIEADSDPQSKPLVLWLNGGPGCSSIAYGEAEELGPFHIRRDGKTLYLNHFAWNRVANIIFLESPVGVGFSYSNTSSDLLDNGDNRTAVDNLNFLLNWFERFPQYKGRDFYLTGESYAGHYVPQLAQAIVKYNQEAKEAINLKGYMVGNALTDDFHDQLGIAQFLWSVGLISDPTYQQLNIQCDLENIEYPSESCDNIWEIAYAEIGDIDMYSIFTPTCPTSSVRLRNHRLKRNHRFGRLRDAYDPCTEEYSTIYFNLPEVQKALHVDPAHKPPQWETCSDLVDENWQDSALTVLDIYRELIPLGLRIWMYSGDTDSVIPVTSTRYTIDALNLTTVSPWCAWYDDGQVGGWTEEYDGLTFVAVRGAGHEVPLHRPNLALTLIKSFLAGSPMPSSSFLQLHSAS